VTPNERLATAAATLFAGALLLGAADARAQGLPGDLLVSEFLSDSVANVRDGGDVTSAPRFATGLSEPHGLCKGPGGEIYVAETGAGEVTVITRGGDFTDAVAFATGLGAPTDLLCTQTQILVSESINAGEVTDITAGGDFSAAPPFASGLVSPRRLMRDSAGRLWAAAGNAIFDITAGGDFSTAVPFAMNGGSLPNGLAEWNGALLVGDLYAHVVRDFSAGGDINLLPVFADLLEPSYLLVVPGVGLFATSDDLAVVYEIGAGGDFTGTPAFATGLGLAANSAGMVFVECAAPASGCIEAEKATVKLIEKKPGNEKLKVTLSKFAEGTTQEDFGDPADGATAYRVCILDAGGAEVALLNVDRAGQACGPKACWTPISVKGYRYKDPDAGSDGLKKIQAKAGFAGKGKLVVQAANRANKGQTALPTGLAAALEGDASATVRVFASDGACFEATLATVQKSDGVQFKAKAP
jgi:hypothetical protein